MRFGYFFSSNFNVLSYTKKKNIQEHTHKKKNETKTTKLNKSIDKERVTISSLPYITNANDFPSAISKARIVYTI